MNIFSELGKKELKEEMLPLALRVDKKGNIIDNGDIIMHIMCKVGYYPAEDDWVVAKRRLTLSDGRRLLVRNE